ncbi:MAG: hypothetical protein V3U43_09165, partial [Pseudomonadales bacterium]
YRHVSPTRESLESLVEATWMYVLEDHPTSPTGPLLRACGAKWQEYFERQRILAGLPRRL